MTFLARYSSDCPLCDQRIQPGQLTRWDREVDGYTHAVCPTPGTETPCSTCHLVHAGDCW